jgi:hypothetical protein
MWQGIKWSKSRTGGDLDQIRGGQMALMRRLPKRVLKIIPLRLYTMLLILILEINLLTIR